MSKEIFPFVVRGLTDKLKRVEADSYPNALNKVLAQNPDRFVTTQFAQRTAGLGLTTSRAAVLPVVRTPNKRYIKFLETMDLQSARKQAAADSKAQKKKLFINVDDEGECVLSSVADKNPDNVMAAFVNGSEVALDEPKQEQAKTTKVNAALSKALKKTLGKVATATVEKVNKLSTNKSESTNEMKSTKKSVPAKKAAKKVAKKASGEKTVPRGNNMFLTEAQWKKVDAKRGDESFSAWSRGLVKKAAGIAD